MDAVADRIVEYGADCLVGVPGQIVRLARSRAGREIGTGRVSSVLLSGDYVVAPMRRAIEEAWGCRVFEHYGSTELGLGGAVQCEALAGLHVREADLLFEVVDPSTGSPVADGEEGELVATTLTRRGMPLIRYRTGDMARMSATPCACGSVLGCLEKVIGRREDLAHLGGPVPLTVADLGEVMYGHDHVLGFAAVLESGPATDRLSVLVEVGGDPSPDMPAALERSLSALPAIPAGAVDLVVTVSSRALPESGAAKQRIVDRRGAT